MHDPISQTPPVTLHFCTSESWGGLEIYAGTLIMELQRAGCPVIAVCAEGSPLHRHLQQQNVRTIAIPGKNVLSLDSLRSIRTLLAREAVDVLHVHFHRDVWLASAALRWNRPAALFLSVYMGVGRKKDLLHRWVYSRLNGIFTSSKALNTVLPDRYPVPAAKIHYLPYGRRLELYRQDPNVRNAVRRSWNIPPDALVAGTMARLDPGKGVMDFIRSFLYLDTSLRDNVHYLVVGEPTRKSVQDHDGSPFEPRSEDYFREMQSFLHDNLLADRVHFTGYQSDLIAYLAAMDVFVFPSRDELYSLAMLDAMAMSLPVLAARSGGNLLQVEEGINGLFFAVGESQELARTLERYLRDPSLRRDHGRAARSFVEREHAMDKVLERLVQFYRTTPYR